MVSPRRARVPARRSGFIHHRHAPDNDPVDNQFIHHSARNIPACEDARPPEPFEILDDVMPGRCPPEGRPVEAAKGEKFSIKAKSRRSLWRRRTPRIKIPTPPHGGDQETNDQRSRFFNSGEGEPDAATLWPPRAP